MRRVVIGILLALFIIISFDTVSAGEDPLLMRKTDSNGVYLTDYGSTFGGLGVQYNPVHISNHAFELWGKYEETNDKKYLDRFMCQARWLYNNQHADGTWRYAFNIPSYGLKEPWISCMAQGLGMKVLCIAYSFNKEQSYMEKAKLSTMPFKYSVRDGGVRSYFSDGTTWYEEYASINTPYYKVLNGFIFALMGLEAYLEDSEDEFAKSLLNEGLSSLDKKIELFDAGYASFYDVAGHVNTAYNSIHVQQLLHYYNRTGNERFRVYARRFDTYEPKKGISASSIVAGRMSPSMLVDGNRFAGSIWERRDRSAQLQLDLGAVRSVDGVNFFFADCRNTPSLIEMAVSADGKRWSNIAGASLNIRGAYYPIDTKKMYIQMLYLKQPVQTRYIRIVLNQGPAKSIRLREIHPLYNQNPSLFSRKSDSTRPGDVDYNDWCYQYVKDLYDRGVTTGYPDGSFKPDNQITRAELATWLSRAYGLETTSSGASMVFPDASSHWAKAYISSAYEAGIIDGYPDGNFKPDSLATRAELAKIIVSAKNLPINKMAESSFSDVREGYWAIPYIETAREFGLVTGYTTHTFNPHAYATRAEAAAMLVRTFAVE